MAIRRIMSVTNVHLGNILTTFRISKCYYNIYTESLSHIFIKSHHNKSQKSKS